MYCVLKFKMHFICSAMIIYLHTYICNIRVFFNIIIEKFFTQKLWAFTAVIQSKNYIFVASWQWSCRYLFQTFLLQLRQKILKTMQVCTSFRNTGIYVPGWLESNLVNEHVTPTNRGYQSTDQRMTDPPSPLPIISIRTHLFPTYDYWFGL